MCFHCVATTRRAFMASTRRPRGVSSSLGPTRICRDLGSLCLDSRQNKVFSKGARGAREHNNFLIAHVRHHQENPSVGGSDSSCASSARLGSPRTGRASPRGACPEHSARLARACLDRTPGAQRGIEARRRSFRTGTEPQLTVGAMGDGPGEV